MNGMRSQDEAQELGAARWGALVLLVALAAVTALVAYAAQLTLASKNLTVYSTCNPMPTTTTDNVDADTWVNQSSGNQNNGTANGMTVQSSGSANRRVYVSFLLSKCSPAIPSTVTVRQATLRPYVTTLPNACRTYDVFRVTSSWTEAAVTWNNQPFGTTLNNPASAQASSQITIGTSPCQNTATGYVTGWDVTADLQAFVSGTATNYGWMIRDDVEASGTARSVTFATKETNNVAQEPQLIVTYQR